MLKLRILANIAAQFSTKENKNGNKFGLVPLAVTAEKDRTFYSDLFVNGALIDKIGEYATTGRSVYVEGIPSMNPRKDDQGNLHPNLSIRGDTILLQDRKGGSRGLAQATLIGRLTDDVDKGETEKGMPRTRARVAVNFKVGDQEKTEYVGVTAFGGLAGVLAYAEKGQKVLIGGNLEPRAYETKNQDVRAELSVTADKVCLMAKAGDNSDSDESGSQAPANRDAGGGDDDMSDDIPF